MVSKIAHVKLVPPMIPQMTVSRCDVIYDYCRLPPWQWLSHVAKPIPFGTSVAPIQSIHVTVCKLTRHLGSPGTLQTKPPIWSFGALPVRVPRSSPSWAYFWYETRHPAHYTSHEGVQHFGNKRRMPMGNEMPTIDEWICNISF